LAAIKTIFSFSLDEDHQAAPRDPDTFGTLSRGPESFKNFPLLGSNSEELKDNDGEEEFMEKISDAGRPRPFDYSMKFEKLLNPKNKDYKKAGAPRLKVNVVQPYG